MSALKAIDKIKIIRLKDIAVSQSVFL